MNMLVTLLFLQVNCAAITPEIGETFSPEYWYPMEPVKEVFENFSEEVRAKFNHNPNNLIKKFINVCYPEIHCKIKGIEYIVSVNTNYKINYIETSAKKFITPEGVCVGMNYKSIKTNHFQRISNECIKLKSGWYAIIKNENKPKISLLFKSNKYPMYVNKDITIYSKGAAYALYKNYTNDILPKIGAELLYPQYKISQAAYYIDDPSFRFVVSNVLYYVFKGTNNAINIIKTTDPGFRSIEGFSDKSTLSEIKKRTGKKLMKLSWGRSLYVISLSNDWYATWCSYGKKINDNSNVEYFLKSTSFELEPKEPNVNE